MALFKSHLVTQMSGSVGGTTYSHTGSGMYMRARSIPVNPNTGNQLQVRAALTSLITRWSETLLAEARAAWNVYAANVPVVNALGDSINLSGQNWYVASNTPRLQTNTKIGISFDIVDNAPTIFDRGTYTTPSFTADAVTGLAITFDAADPFNVDDQNGLLVYVSRPQNGSRNFFKGPFRLQTVIHDSAVSPVTITQTLLAANSFALLEGQAVWLKFVQTLDDGRLASPRIVGPVIVTP